MILEEIKNINSSKTELKKFGLTIGVVLLIISAYLFYKFHVLSWYFIAPGLFLILSGFLIPMILKPFHKIWMGLAVVLGWFSTRVILSVLFYLVMFPIRLIAKLSGKEFLVLKIDKDKTSYWNYREKKEFNPDDCEKQF